MLPILVLDAYLDERGGGHNFERLLADRPHRTVRTLHGALPSDPTAYAGLVLTGSAASVQSPPAWLAALCDLVRRALRSRVPVLGICFGHQVLAQAAFGPGSVRSAPRGELGWIEIERLGPDPLLDALPPRFSCFASHHDEVVPGPAAMRVLARSPDCAVQAFRVADRPAWGVQFHPEMERAETDELVRAGLAGHPHLGRDVEAVLAGGSDSLRLGRPLLERFAALTGSPLPEGPEIDNPSLPR